MLQDLGSYHLSILLTVPLSPVFRPNESLPPFNFQKARWDNLAFYFDSHCSSAVKYSSLSLSFAAVLFTSLTLNALLTIWCFGQTALAYLPTALFVALRPPFSFHQAQYAQVFLLKPAPFCMLFSGLGNTNKSDTSLLLSASRPVLAILSSLSSLLLPQSLWQELFSLFSFTIRLQWVHGHSFLSRNDVADELARRGALLVPSAIPCSLSPPISHIQSSLFSDWRHTVSSTLDFHRGTCASTSCLLCFLSSSLQRTQSSVKLYLYRIGRIKNPSCSACGYPSQDTSHLILHCLATDSLRRSVFCNFLSLYDLWSRPWRVARLLGLDGLPPSTHPLEGVG